MIQHLVHLLQGPLRQNHAGILRRISINANVLILVNLTVVCAETNHVIPTK